PLVAPLKALVSAVCIGSGGSAGREGPIVQIGASFGSSLGQFFQMTPKKIETLLASGAAAGIAGTFNAPLAGVMFSLEVLLKDIELESFTPIVVSAVVGTGVANLFFGAREAIFDVPEHVIVSVWEIIPYIGLGIVAAGIALLFSNSLYYLEHVFEEIKFPAFLKPAVGGLLLGSLALWIPQIHATGYPVMEEALHAKLPLLMVFTLMLAKILATDLTLGSGGSGGIFAPSLFIGSMMGAAYGGFLNSLFPSIIAGPGSYALVGMGAMFAGATHAPLTSIIIIFEMTRDPMIFLPLMFACIISTALTSRIQHRNIYTTKILNRGIDIEKAKETSILKDLQVEKIMNTDLITLNEDNTVEEAKEIFQKTFYSDLPVIDKETDKLLGMVSYHQIMRRPEDKRKKEKTIESCAHPLPAIIHPHDDLLKALKLLNRTNMKVAPVISNDKEEKLIGIISRSNIIEAYHKEIAPEKEHDIFTNYSPHYEVGIKKLLNISMAPLEKQAEEKDISINLDIKDELPPASANFNKISWVLTNLLGNAIRYSNKGDEIDITAEHKNDMIYISVTDHGPGIPQKYQRKIFEKYVQLDDIESEKGKGLGLAISKEIIEEHGGNIWVESEVGKGSTFIFTLETLPEDMTDIE
ncbi:MAG: chloride channel protein, partial [Halanaerobiales bacterium]